MGIDFVDVNPVNLVITRWVDFATDWIGTAMVNPYAASQSEMEDSQPSLSEGAILRAWIGFTVFATICGFIAGAVAGAIVGIAMQPFDASQSSMQLAGGAAGFLVGLPISYGFYRRSVKKLLSLL